MTDRTRQITAKQPLIGRAVKNFLRRNPSFGFLKDDLRSAAQESLIKSIDHGRDDDAHIVRSILSHLSAMVDLEANGIRVPASTRREAKRNGKQLAPIQCESLTQNHTDNLIDTRSGDPLQDIFDSCKSDREKTIVRMLAEGYKKSEVAVKFGVHPGRITHILKGIEQRYDSDEAIGDEPYQPAAQGRDGCRCGRPVARWTNATTCEACFADDSFKFDGRSRRVKYAA